MKFAQAEAKHVGVGEGGAVIGFADARAMSAGKKWRTRWRILTVTLGGGTGGCDGGHLRADCFAVCESLRISTVWHSTLCCEAYDNGQFPATIVEWITADVTAWLEMKRAYKLATGT